MEKWKKRSVELIAGLALSDKKDPAVIPYLPKKTRLCPKEPLYFTRVSPERQGISTATLRCMLSELETEKRANTHSLLVLSHGGVLCRCAAPGYDGAIPHLAHSMSKTVTGMAIGFLAAEGRLALDHRVGDLLPEFPMRDKRLRTLTVKHLLTMQSGVKFSEAGVVTETHWTAAFFASALSAAPGTAFHYNSMNSYILAVILHRLTGEGLVDYLMPRLFAPLHIERPLWQLGPEGIECGGWGLFLTDDAWGKLGMLLSDGGRFEDKQILPASFVQAMTSPQAKTPEALGDFDYGYHVWVGRESREILFNGMLGQNVWCYPARGLVAVISSGNNEIFAQSPALSILRRRLLFPLPIEENRFQIHRREYAQSQATFGVDRHWIRATVPTGGFLSFLRHKRTGGYDTRWDRLEGTLLFRQNNNGILPLFVRVMENCYTGGIDSLAFHRRGERLWMTVTEGGTPLMLEIGLKDFAETELHFRDEVYLVRAMGEVMEDEEGRAVYKIELCFPELPNQRRIKLLEQPDGCFKMRLDEMPNQELAKAFVESFPSKNALLNELLERRLGDGYLHRLMKDAFSPSLLAVPSQKENAMALLEQEEKLRAARRRSLGFITGIVSRFFEEPPAAQPAEKRSVIADLLARFKAPKKQNEKRRPDAFMESESRIHGKEKRTEIAPLGASAEAKVAKVVALIEKNEDER
ncbi:MAG: serine hydrolase [Clostridia bacterium]|nr:serine hydrolase [Clostridia bacterium]